MAGLGEIFAKGATKWGAKAGVGALNVGLGAGAYAGKKVLSLGTVPVAAYIGDKLVFDGAGLDYINKSFDNPQGFINDISNSADVIAAGAAGVATRAADVANEGSFAGKFAFLETIGKIWNKLFGGVSGLKFMNFFGELGGKATKHYTKDGLKTVEEIAQESTPDMKVSNLPAPDFKIELTRQMNTFADPVTGEIDYSTENLMAAAKKADPAFANELNGIAKTDGLPDVQNLYKTFNGLQGMSSANDKLNTVTNVRESVRNAEPDATLDNKFLKQAM